MSARRAILYLVDASIYVFRGWFTLPDTITDPDGRPVNAVVGFADFLLQLLDRERPTHLALAFDESLTSSWRNQLYAPYKANRESAPAELKYQFACCRALGEAAGVACFSSPVLEADDIIATLAANARAAGFRSRVLSADKDLTQVLREDDEWWDFARDVRLSVAGVQRKFGVRPEQIGDLLALAGDPVDNIPGVRGIGAKTAARLLRRWDDIPTLLEHLDELGGAGLRGAERIGTLLAEHREQLLLTRRITALRHDEALPRAMAELARRPPDEAALAAQFERLAFGAARRARWSRITEAAT